MKWEVENRKTKIYQKTVETKSVHEKLGKYRERGRERGREGERRGERQTDRER